MNEFELIQKYFKKDPLDSFVVVGNGDDAAVFAPDNSTILISSSLTRSTYLAVGILLPLK